MLPDPAPPPPRPAPTPPLALRGLAWLLVLQTAGELLARALSLPFPGPVVGMVLLLAAMPLPAVRTPVAACAEALLAHLSLLFVPVGVGVMAHLGLLGTFGGRMLLVVVLSTWAGLAATALTLRWLQPAADADRAPDNQEDAADAGSR